MSTNVDNESVFYLAGELLKLTYKTAKDLEAEVEKAVDTAVFVRDRIFTKSSPAAAPTQPATSGNIDVPDSYKMPFGKHKGKLIGAVPASYLLWLAENGNNVPEPITRYVTAKRSVLDMMADDERAQRESAEGGYDG